MGLLGVETRTNSTSEKRYREKSMGVRDNLTLPNHFSFDTFLMKIIAFSMFYMVKDKYKN